jgi:hypothetical protein
MNLNWRKSIDVDVDLIKVDTQATHAQQKETPTLAPPPLSVHALPLHVQVLGAWLESLCVGW